jgi:transcriptional regulator with XRE-family HTH domain
MSFKSIRDQRHLSQEKIADMSGLSLRTIQRLEAGHRVSYASLRALAVPLAMDVDLLEQVAERLAVCAPPPRTRAGSARRGPMRRTRCRRVHGFIPAELRPRCECGQNRSGHRFRSRLLHVGVCPHPRQIQALAAQRCLTCRSTGHAAAGHTRRAAGTRYIVCGPACAPCRGAPVNSTRASPFVKRMNPIEPRSGSIHFRPLLFCCCVTALRASRRSVEPRCGRTNYNRSLMQRCSLPSVAADPDERRARGPHSLAADSLCCRLELIRHTPRRSNLAHQRCSHHAVEETGSVFFLSSGFRYWLLAVGCRLTPPA